MSMELRDALMDTCQNIIKPVPLSMIIHVLDATKRLPKLLGSQDIIMERPRNMEQKRINTRRAHKTSTV
jgi:hypothetical protein